MTKWDELKDWIEKGAFYCGNETPKWVVSKILNKIEYLEKADNLIGIDFPLEDKTKDSAFIVSHDEKKVIDEKLAALTRYIDTRYAEVKEHVNNRIYNSETKCNRIMETKIRALDTRISNFIDNHLQNHEDVFNDDFEDEDEPVDSYESMWRELLGWLITTDKVPSHLSNIIVDQMKRLEKYGNINKEKS